MFDRIKFYIKKSIREMLGTEPHTEEEVVAAMRKVEHDTITLDEDDDNEQ